MGTARLFGEAIRAASKEVGFTQEKLAEKPTSLRCLLAELKNGCSTAPGLSK